MVLLQSSTRCSLPTPHGETAEAAYEEDLLTQHVIVRSSGTTLDSATPEQSRLPGSVSYNKGGKSRQKWGLPTGHDPIFIVVASATDSCARGRSSPAEAVPRDASRSFPYAHQGPRSLLQKLQAHEFWQALPVLIQLPEPCFACCTYTSKISQR